MALGSDPGPVVEPPLERKRLDAFGTHFPGFQFGAIAREEVANTVSCREHSSK